MQVSAAAWAAATGFLLLPQDQAVVAICHSHTDGTIIRSFSNADSASEFIRQLPFFDGKDYMHSISTSLLLGYSRDW